MAVDRNYLDSLTWHQDPRDAGQIVEYHYACTESGVYERRSDGSDGKLSYQFARWRKNASQESMRFEPWNGLCGLAGCCKLQPVILEN